MDIAIFARVASAEAGATTVITSVAANAVVVGETIEQVVPAAANLNVAFVVPFTSTRKSVCAVAAVPAEHIVPVKLDVESKSRTTTMRSV